MRYMSLDIETDGTNPLIEGGLLCIGWHLQGSDHVQCEQTVTPEVAALLQDSEVAKVAHTKYDVVYLRRMGVDVRGPVYDTQVMAWLGNENQSLALDDLLLRYCDIKLDKRINQVGNRALFRLDSGATVPMKAVPWPVLKRYNLADVRAEAALFKKLAGDMNGTEWDAYFIREEVPFTHLLIEMELNGVPINLGRANDLREALTTENIQQRHKLNTMLGYPINWNSPDQLREVLFTKLWYEPGRVTITPLQRAALKAGEGFEEQAKGFEVKKVGRLYAHGFYTRKGLGLKPTPPKKTKGTEKPSTKPSVGAKVLKLHHPEVPLIQEYLKWKKVEKVIGTYLNTYEKRSHNGRIYGRFNQTGTKTGRLSSSGPNLQNQPSRGVLGKAIRELFQGRLIVGDYSQLEPRLMAHFSGDPVLTRVYETGDDVYLVTAEGIWGERPDKGDPRRDMSKLVFLGDQYGQGAKALAAELTVAGYPTTTAEADHYQSSMHRTYSGLTAWKEDVVKRATRDGYVRTLAGRKRRLQTSLRSRDWKLQGYGARQAVNAIIQGTAGDVVRRCLVEVDKQLGDVLATLCQVHDEAIWEMPAWAHAGTKDLDELRRIMELGHGFDLRVPLVFEPVVCRTWADKGIEGLAWEDIDEEDE